MKYEIRDQDGAVRSIHRTKAAAEREMRKNQNWRCGICGSTRGGWGACSHGPEQLVCTAKYYNDQIRGKYESL